MQTQMLGTVHEPPGLALRVITWNYRALTAILY